MSKDSDLMLTQTLVVGKGENRKFYGYRDDIGWTISSIPINIFPINITMTNLKQVYNDHNFTDVRLVRVKMQIIDKTKMTSEEMTAMAEKASKGNLVFEDVFTLLDHMVEVAKTNPSQKTSNIIEELEDHLVAIFNKREIDYTRMHKDLYNGNR